MSKTKYIVDKGWVGSTVSIFTGAVDRTVKITDNLDQATLKLLYELKHEAVKIDDGK